MKNTILFLFIILMSVSCSKKKVLVENEIAESQVLPYDTTAIDSFAPGATPNNVIMKRVIVDSATLAKMEEQKLIAKKKKEETYKKAKAKLEEEEKILSPSTEDQQ